MRRAHPSARATAPGAVLPVPEQRESRSESKGQNKDQSQRGKTSVWMTVDPTRGNQSDWNPQTLNQDPRGKLRHHARRTHRVRESADIRARNRASGSVACHNRVRGSGQHANRDKSRSHEIPPPYFFFTLSPRLPNNTFFRPTDFPLHTFFSGGKHAGKTRGGSTSSPIHPRKASEGGRRIPTPSSQRLRSPGSTASGTTPRLG